MKQEVSRHLITRALNAWAAEIIANRRPSGVAYMDRAQIKREGSVATGLYNPITGTWTKRNDKSGKFVEVKTSARRFNGSRSER